MTSSSTITRVNLGPLTTVFTPPASCSTVFAGQLGEHFISQWGMSCRSPGGYDYDYSCYPSAYASAISGTAVVDRFAVYSPANQCPQGFAPACTVSRQTDQVMPAAELDRLLWQRLAPGETAVGCCPSGLSCAKDGINSCEGWPTKGQVYSGVSYDENCRTTVSATLTVTNDPDHFFADSDGFRVHLILGSKPNNAAGPTGTDSSVTTDTLPLGAKIGIGVGVPVLFLWLAIGLGLFCLCRRRKKRQRQVGYFNPPVPQQSQPMWSHGPGVPLESNARPVEMTSMGETQELYSKPPRYEIS